MRDRWTPAIGNLFDIKPWQMDDLKPVELTAIETSIRNVERTR